MLVMAVVLDITGRVKKERLMWLRRASGSLMRELIPDKTATLVVV